MATTIATRVLGFDTLLREPRLGNDVKEHDLARENLPFIAKNAKVVDFRNPITGQGLSTPKVAQHSNGVAKRLWPGYLELKSISNQRLDWYMSWR
jgi:hypothetical protein